MWCALKFLPTNVPLKHQSQPTLIMLTTVLPILLAELIVNIFSDVWFSTYKQIRGDDDTQATVRFAVSLLFSTLALAYYS